MTIPLTAQTLRRSVGALVIQNHDVANGEGRSSCRGPIQIARIQECVSSEMPRRWGGHEKHSLDAIRGPNKGLCLAAAVDDNGPVPHLSFRKFQIPQHRVDDILCLHLGDSRRQTLSSPGRMSNR